MCEYCGELFMDYDDVVSVGMYSVHRECLRSADGLEATAGDLEE